jgi:hypothetical protein
MTIAYSATMAASKPFAQVRGPGRFGTAGRRRHDEAEFAEAVAFALASTCPGPGASTWTALTSPPRAVAILSIEGKLMCAPDVIVAVSQLRRLHAGGEAAAHSFSKRADGPTDSGRPRAGPRSFWLRTGSR